MFYLPIAFYFILYIQCISPSNITLYIDNQIQFNCSTFCNGSDVSPFPDLFYAIHFLETHTIPDLTIVSMKNENNLLTDDSIQPYLTAMNLTYYWPVFQNMVNKTIVIKSFLNSSHLLVKTRKLSFIPNPLCNLTIEKLIFHGNDLNMPSNYIQDPNFTNCYYSLNFCCGFDGFLDSTINSSQYSHDLICKFDTRVAILQPSNPFSFLYQAGTCVQIIDSVFMNFYLYSFSTAINSKEIILQNLLFLNMSVNLYFGYFSNTNLFVLNTTFQNILFNSSETNDRYVILDKNSKLVFNSSVMKGIETPRLLQTILWLGLNNTLIVINSNIIFTENTQVQLIHLIQNNKLFMSQCSLNQDTSNLKNLWTYNWQNFSN